MRVWRFVDGKAVDALNCDDTYSLDDMSDFPTVGILYKGKKVDWEAAYESLKSSYNRGFDYICTFRGFIFPVKDRETRSLTQLVSAMESRIQDGTGFKYF